MEAFVASNEGQWEVIKRVIEECDYYVLIIGARYGSTTKEGISYTKKEYNYAKSLGLPVLAFVHANPDNIPVVQAERVPELREKLDAFRTRVMDVNPVGKWTTSAELGGVVSRSLVREIKWSPRPGWIRNDGSSPIALLERINALTKENEELHSRLSVKAPEIADADLSSGDDKTVIYGRRREYVDYPHNGDWVVWRADVSWNDLFRDLGPALINEASEQELKDLASISYLPSDKEEGGRHLYRP